MYLRVCLNCKQSFESHKPEAKYCSVTCKMDYKRVTITCATCGKKFVKARSQEKMFRYCSKECGSREGEYRNCVICGKEFYIKRSHIARRPGLYCSIKCAGQAITKPVEPPKPLYDIRNSVGEDFITCLICHQDFRSLGGHLKRAHDVSAEEYRKRFGFNRQSSLSCKQTRAIKKVTLHQITPEETAKGIKCLDNGMRRKTYSPSLEQKLNTLGHGRGKTRKKPQNIRTINGVDYKIT